MHMNENPNSRRYVGIGTAGSGLRRRPHVAALMVLCVMALAACQAHRQTPVSAAQLSKKTAGSDAVTIRGGGVDLEGYLFRPKGEVNLAPAVVVLHGWGGSAGGVSWLARHLSRRGYVALALTMRGFGNSGGRDDCGLRQPEDTVAALNWLKMRPGVDPGRMGIVGLSQGGQVALLAAALSDSPRAVAAFFPATDVALWGRTTNHPDIPGYVRRTCRDGEGRSPLKRANGVHGTVLLIHGDEDRRVPTAQSCLMAAALHDAGKPVRLHLVPGAVHRFSEADWDAALPVLYRFLDRNLKHDAGAPDRFRKVAIDWQNFQGKFADVARFEGERGQFSVRMPGTSNVCSGTLDSEDAKSWSITCPKSRVAFGPIAPDGGEELGGVGQDLEGNRVSVVVGPEVARPPLGLDEVPACGT